MVEKKVSIFDQTTETTDFRTISTDFRYQTIFEKFNVLIADQTLLGPMFEQI